MRAVLNAIYACRRLLVCRTNDLAAGSHQSEDHPHLDEYCIRITNRTYDGWPVWEEVGGEIFHRTFSERNQHNMQEFVFGAKILDHGDWMDDHRVAVARRRDAAPRMPRFASDDHESVREGGHMVRRWVLDDGERGEWKRFTRMGLYIFHQLPNDDALMVEARRLIDEANQRDYNENHFSDDEDEE